MFKNKSKLSLLLLLTFCLSIALFAQDDLEPGESLQSITVNEELVQKMTESRQEIADSIVAKKEAFQERFETDQQNLAELHDRINEAKELSENATETITLKDVEEQQQSFMNYSIRFAIGGIVAFLAMMAFLIYQVRKRKLI